MHTLPASQSDEHLKPGKSCFGSAMCSQPAASQTYALSGFLRLRRGRCEETHRCDVPRSIHTLHIHMNYSTCFQTTPSHHTLLVLGTTCVCMSMCNVLILTSSFPHMNPLIGAWSPRKLYTRMLGREPEEGISTSWTTYSPYKYWIILVHVPRNTLLRATRVVHVILSAHNLCTYQRGWELEGNKQKRKQVIICDVVSTLYAFKTIEFG